MFVMAPGAAATRLGVRLITITELASVVFLPRF
jgi:hypothetical protein